ncbi:toxic anion resistance protein [Streptomyces parvus]|uniref:toxic anion resistance protein n=1 Tax=Streptomyces parvus TaxID=66428 RepID=UPI003F4D071E
MSTGTGLPAPVAPVRAEQATELVPVAEVVRADLLRRAEEYVDGLAGLDARSPEFGTRVAEIASLGLGDIRGAAQQSNRMLDRTVRSPASGEGDAPARVGSSLVELRRTMEDLDPQDTPERGARHLLSRLSGGRRQALVDGLREAEEVRQRSHTRYLEDRGFGAARPQEHRGATGAVRAEAGRAETGRPPEP